MAVRTYNPSVRVGNWTEDLVLQEDHVKDFLDKKENNQLLIQKATNLLHILLQPEKLSESPDGCIHIGDRVCLMHVPTQSVISGHMSAYKSQEATKLFAPCKVTSSARLQPCHRNIFVVGSYGSSAKVGDPVHYEELITFTTLSGPGGQLLLESDRATLMDHSKYTREQELKLTDEMSYKAAWKIVCFNPEDRLESAGMPVPTNQLIFINHSKTNNNIAVHADFKPRTPFGREFETTGKTRYNLHKIELEHNHFMVVTGSYLEELIAKKEEEKS